jgi:branched-chain amino acid transport system ATP-binding protein
MALLETRKLTKYFGGLCAVNQVDLDVLDSEILGLVGPNGAGKSTMFNIIAGFFAPTSGTVVFKGEDITGLRADQIARKGIGRTFQASTLFMESTVFDNILAGSHIHYKQSGWKSFFHTPATKKEELGIRQKTTEILEMMDMVAVKDALAMNLAYGFQRILGVCMSLAVQPQLLLLDEPLTGMNPSEKLSTINKIRQIRDKGITVILVEHDMKSVMSVCDRVVVLNYGVKIADGRPNDIRGNKEVIEAYLGGTEDID